MWGFLEQHYLNIILGFSISFLISFYAYKKHSLAWNGLIAALLLGTVIYTFGGLYFMGILLVFFISSSLLSKLSKEEKTDARRTYKQVLANGIIGAVLSVLYYFLGDDIYKLLYTISFAVSTADTWASEIGKLSNSIPRHILSWKKIDKGLSGGVTPLGMVASVMGSALISVFMIFNPIVIFWGFLGSIIDSVLGTIQVKYITIKGKILDELQEDVEIVKTTGLRFLSNNLVNFLSNLIIVSVTYLIIQ